MANLTDMNNPGTDEIVEFKHSDINSGNSHLIELGAYI